MAFSRRLVPSPRVELCPTCKKNPAIVTRPDKRCPNCARPLDAAAKTNQEVEAARQKK